MEPRAATMSGPVMHATLSLTFDNLGEAAEVGAGAHDRKALGGHPTATVVVPSILDGLRSRGLSATFFVEGLNAEAYPDLLRRIDAEGHEVAYHAWTHEQWGELEPEAQAENLARGAEAFGRLGLTMTGMRPPGGSLGAGGAEVLRRAGLEYCSPAGRGAGAVRGLPGGDLALLPFQWRHVDAVCVLPTMSAVREQMTGSPQPIEPGQFLAFLDSGLDALTEGGGFASIVLHPFMREWFGEDRLDALLDRVEAARANGLRVTSCREVAAQIVADAETFEEGTTLDPTDWSG
jgi:peptidoglycan/xylan/chitin deacetylase (PgdA/CDA1 family)